MAEEDKLMIQELAARVVELEAAVQNLGKSDQSDDGLRERISRERDGRIEKQRDDRFVANQLRHNGPQPTSQHRREELMRRTSTSLPAPENKRPRQRAEAAPEEGGASGTPIDFYCWKDGEIAIVKVLCEGEPTIVT